MRTFWRALDGSVLRSIGLVCLADAIVGASFGAIAVAADLPLWLPVALSVFVFAGASQFIFVGLVASGGNPFAALLAGLLVNARHLPLGLAVGDVIGPRWGEKVLGSHLLVDESVAFALNQKDPVQRRAAYWITGVGLFLCWNAGVLLGAWGGGFLADPEVLGLDAAFPAVLLALMIPLIKDARMLLAAAIGAAVALTTAPFLPAGISFLLSLLGVLVALGPLSNGGDELPVDEPPSPNAAGW